MSLNRRDFIAKSGGGALTAVTGAAVTSAALTTGAAAAADSVKLPYGGNKIHAMPAHFGGREGGLSSTTYWDTDTASVFYETDGDALARFLPPGFTLLRPEIVVAAMMNRGVEWMGGEPYNITAVNVPVRYVGAEDEVEGWYSLVVWENNTTPILTGREATGIPKIPANIEDFRFHNSEMRTWVHANGHTFCDMHLKNIAAADSETLDAIDSAYKIMNWMGWRYIPAISPTGGAALSEPTLYPQEFHFKEASVADGVVEWHVPPVWRIPTQHHIIAQIAALPVGRSTSKAVVIRHARNVLRGDLARVLK